MFNGLGPSAPKGKSEPSGARTRPTRGDAERHKRSVRLHRASARGLHGAIPAPAQRLLFSRLLLFVNGQEEEFQMSCEDRMIRGTVDAAVGTTPVVRRPIRTGAHSGSTSVRHALLHPAPHLLALAAAMFLGALLASLIVAAMILVAAELFLLTHVPRLRHAGGRDSLARSLHGDGCCASGARAGPAASCHCHQARRALGSLAPRSRRHRPARRRLVASLAPESWGVPPARSA